MESIHENPPSILVVDSTESTRNQLIDLLRSAGLAGIAANSAADALYMTGIHGEDPFDLYIIEASMPGTNGIDLFHRLRELGVQTPVIFTTDASGISRFTPEYLHNFSLHVLQKPFRDAQAIRDTIISALDAVETHRL